jgi:hypothetical protein
LIAILSLFVTPRVYGSIASSTGDVVIVPAPASVADGTNESDTQVIAFQERVGVVLPALPASVSDVPAGTIVNSYLLHFDPVGAIGASHQVAGSVTFNEPVLGFFYSAEALAATDAILGNPNTFYGSSAARQAEFTGIYPPPSPLDFIGVAGNTVTVDWRANSQADEVRVITQGMRVEIDIQPGSPQNVVNVKSRGVIRAAILGNPSLDVSQIDVTSLHLENLSVHISGGGVALCAAQDANGDSVDDLVCQFMNDGTLAPVSGEATVSGFLNNGAYFEGQDAIQVVP